MVNHHAISQPTQRKLSMVLLLLIAFGVMIHGLDDLILWADEAWTIYASDPAIPLTHTYDRVVHDIHPPLFFLELHLWRTFTGSTIFEMRYFSLLLLMLATTLVYRLGTRLFSHTAGMVAAGFLIFSDLEHVFAQEVRHYAQQQLFTVLVMWVYWRFWEHPTRKRAIALSLAGAALLWSYYWGGFVLLGLGLHALVTKRRDVLRFIPVFAAMGVLFLPWVPNLISQFTDLPEGLSYSLNNSWASLATLTRQLAGEPGSLWLLLIVAGIPAALPPRAKLRLWPSSATLLPTLIIITAAFFSVALNTTFESLFTRSLAIIVPSLALLLGHTISQMRWPEAGVIAAMLVILSLALENAAPVGRAEWNVVADYLAHHATANDLLLLEMDYRQSKNLEELTLLFYLDRSGTQLRAISTDKVRTREPEHFQAYLDEQLAGENHLWVVKLGWPYYSFHEELVARGYTDTAPITAFEPFSGRPVELWRLDRAGGSTSGENALNTFGDIMQLRWQSIQANADWVTVNLLWSALLTPETNYSVSTFLLDQNGALVSQHDSYPLENRSPTSTWTTDQLYFDSHAIPTETLPAGDYQVGLKVYTFTDESFQTIEQLPAADCNSQPDCDFVIIGTVHIP